MVQKHAVVVVKNVRKKRLQEHREQEKDLVQRRLWLHQQKNSNHVVHSLPVSNIVFGAVSRDDGSQLRTQFGFAGLLNHIKRTLHIHDENVIVTEALFRYSFLLDLTACVFVIRSKSGSS